MRSVRQTETDYGGSGGVKDFLKGSFELRVKRWKSDGEW